MGFCTVQCLSFWAAEAEAAIHLEGFEEAGDSTDELPIHVEEAKNGEAFGCVIAVDVMPRVAVVAVSLVVGQ